MNIKMCKGIEKSESTLVEKLTFDPKILQTEESKAIFNMVLLIKQRLERDSVQSGSKDGSCQRFENLADFGVETFDDPNDKSHAAQSLKLARTFVSMPMRHRRATMIEKQMNLSEEELEARQELSYI